MKELKVRQACPDESVFAWPLYSEFVRANLFNGGPHRASITQWDDSKESAKFDQYWETSSHHMIEIDNLVVGWLCMVETPTKIVIENVFLSPQWRQKGIVGRYLKEMTPAWRKKSLKIDVSVLKDTGSSSHFIRMLTSLGYNRVASDDLTETFQAS